VPTLAEIRAEKSRRNLGAFTNFTIPNYVESDHQRKLDEALEAVERGEIDRLMVFMPPRHGKSEKVTKRFPAWYLGRNPRRMVISSSYNIDLAMDFGREVKNIIASQEFEHVFPEVRLRADSRAADRMNTEQGGAYFAAGVGTATTGRGMHLGIIDDPIKDREQADSELQRNRVWNWYRSTFYTRLMPDGAIILVQTRWHEDDLAGRLLAQDGRVEDGGQWTVLELPAINQAGEALWPEWYPLKTLERIKDTIGPREWSALFQQQPQPDEGTFFQRDWFKEWDVRPRLRLYGTSDYAVTDGGGDFTVHRVWGIDAAGVIYRVDGWRGQSTSDVWIERKLDLIERYKPLAWFGEGGVIQKAIEPLLMRRMRERKAFCRLEWLPSIHDKPTRARSFQAMAASGRVYFEKGADLSEFLSFPAGKHDDEVDVAGMIGRALDQAHPAILPPDRSARQNDMWADDDRATADWRTA
jgi:predicted phage terminase large subunit-like protein